MQKQEHQHHKHHFTEKRQQNDFCKCGHDHSQDQPDNLCLEHNNCEHNHSHPDPFRTEGVTFTCLVENLGCANCASKMESKINQLSGVNAATLTFATKQLRVSVTPEAAKRESALIEEFQKICASIESGTVVRKQQPSHKGKKALMQTEEQTKHWHGLSEHQADLIFILFGALLFTTGEIIEHWATAFLFISNALYIAAYLILGGQILLTAAKNLSKGQIFDENFLMSLATLGAFAIGDFAEAVGVMLFYRVGEYFEERAVSRSRSQIMDAVDMRPETVHLVLGDTIKELSAENATPGDLLIVRPGDRIPLDGTIVEGESRLDTSPITGEPVPIKATIGDGVTSGCINLSGQLTIRVEKTLDQSMVTRILDSVENAAASKPKIDRFITRFSKIYTPFVVTAAIATAILPSLFTGDWNHWIYTSLTFLVISCPCALVLSVPLAFFSGIGSGSKKGILFKGGVSIEALNHISTVIMDKTGTITKGNFVVQNIIPIGNISAEKLLTLCASCEQHSNHPIGISITAAAQEQHLVLEAPLKLQEIAGHGIQAQLSEGELLAGNRNLMEKFHVDFSAYTKISHGTEVFVAVNGALAGVLVISDTIKPEASHAISSLKRLHISTAMLTGDTLENAQAVANETGIDEVHARMLPEEKLNRLQEIRSKNGAVMFVGDGINDAPVLAGADVGAAMGSGADAAIEAADVVFMTSNMQAVPQSIAIAKATTRIAWQNVIFALIIKALVMILGLTGHASMWMAVFADSGVAMLCVLNSIRVLYKKS